MAAHVKAFDWSTTPIGSIDEWPQSLRTALQMLLTSKAPMQILWGAEYVQFYNDPYIPIAGNKHPTALGQRGSECWQEVWDFAGPLLDSVRLTGQATLSEDQLLVLNRHGHSEEGYFTFSYNPIWNDFGDIGGILVVVNETTQQVISERREHILLSEAQAAKKELENVLVSINDEFMLFDAEWRFTYINRRAAETMGKPSHELLGECIWALFPNSVDTTLYQKLHQAIDSQKGTSFEYFCPVKERWLEHRVYPFGDGLSLLRVDITQRKQLEQALQASQIELSSILNTAHASIAKCRFYANRTYTVDYHSIGSKALTGYGPEEITADLWVTRTVPEDWDAISDLAFNAIFNEEPITLEYRFQHRDGSLRWISDNLTSRRDDDQDCWIVTMVGIDITDRKQTEEALRQSEAHLLMAQRVAQIGSWEFYLDTKESVWSDTVFNQWGLDSSQQEPSYAELMQRIHPEDRDVVKQHIEQTLREGKPYALDLRIILPDGGVRYLYSRSQPVFDQQGQIVKLIGTSLDITDRKQIEAALRESEERLQLALQGADCGSWDYDLINGQMIWSERCKTMFGLESVDEINYPVFRQAVHPDDQERIDQSIKGAIAQQHDYDVEMRTLWPDGTIHWVRSIGRVYHNPGGLPVRMAGVVLDISSQKQIEAERAHLLEREQIAREAAEHANQIKDEFLAVLSHELRSPLTPILGWARLLRLNKVNDAKKDCALETIERNAQLQAQLIDDLLDVSRILRGKLILKTTPTYLPAVIEGALETVRSVAAGKGIQITTQIDKTPYQLSGDSNRLKQVAWNLLSNAVKFTPQGGRVILRLAYADAFATMQVIDTGNGISADFLPHVFDRFRQADSTTTRMFGGLGLGLAIAHQIVEMHGGTIQATSPGEGQGATFTVHLPLALTELESPQPARPATVLHNLQHVHVLVVEDDPDTRDLVATTLQQFGAKVTVEPSAAVALTALSQFRPDIIISDIGMPDMDGYMLMQQIREATQTSQIPAIALTAYISEADQQKALAVGFQMHLAKPIEPTQLVEAVSTLLQR